MSIAHAQQSLALPTNGESQTAEEKCPWCEQPITHDKFNEIESRIKTEEQRRVDELTDQLHAEFHKDKVKHAAKHEADLKRVQQEAAARETAARQEAAKAAEAAMVKKLAKAEEAKRNAEEQIKVVKAEQEQQFTKRLKEALIDQRGAFEKTKEEAVNEEKARAFETQEKLKTKLEQLQKQLEEQAADDAGEGSDIDLFEVLRSEFPEDRFERIGNGEPGANIRQTIQHNGQDYECIVYDSKNRNQWRSNFVSKLRTDQLAAKANHAILTTQRFPAGERQLCIREEVIVTNPARVVELVRLLREHAIKIGRLRLSNEERGEKMAALYDFLSSDRGRNLLTRVEALADDMLELEVEEQKAHQRTWKRRGELIRSTQKTHADFCREVDQIIEHGRTS